MREFFGFGGYTREPEGYLSWQHLLFVGSMLTLMVILAIWIGNRQRLKTPKEKNRVLVIAAPLIVGLELINITILCFRESSADPIRRNLPLFLCSIQFIAIPLAAFSKGRLKEAAIDFVCIFGILGAVFGTIGAGQKYNSDPVLSWDNMVSAMTHSISGFSSLYIMIARYASMKKQNIGITFGIITGFCAAAYVTNVLIDYNYMFLMAGDGTPYDILYNLVNGNKVLYPLGVVALFLLYIAVFYGLFFVFTRRKAQKVASAEQ